MFAKAIQQDKEIKKIFYERIKEKVEREKQNVKDKIDEEYPKILSWLDSFIFFTITWQSETHVVQ